LYYSALSVTQAPCQGERNQAQVAKLMTGMDDGVNEAKVCIAMRHWDFGRE
jgi:hypothetical protein